MTYNDIVIKELPERFKGEIASIRLESGSPVMIVPLTGNVAIKMGGDKWCSWVTYIIWGNEIIPHFNSTVSVYNEALSITYTEAKEVLVIDCQQNPLHDREKQQ